MSQEKLKKQILEAKRWPELVTKTQLFVAKYGEPTLRQMSEVFDCSLDVLHNIGDSVEGLEIVRHKDDDSDKQDSLRIIASTCLN